jgi:hypothetical protein
MAGRALNSRAMSIAYNSTSSRGSGAAFGCCSGLPEVAARRAVLSKSGVPPTRRLWRDITGRGGLGWGEERPIPSWLLKPDSRKAVHREVRRILRGIPSEAAERDALKFDLDALVREGARRMLVRRSKPRSMRRWPARTHQSARHDGQQADHRDEAATCWLCATAWPSRGDDHGRPRAGGPSTTCARPPRGASVHQRILPP